MGLDSHVSHWEFQRGRSNEIEQTQPGSATIDLIDKTGDYDPTNTGGPYYAGGLDPMRPLIIPLFDQFAHGWSSVWRGWVGDWDYDIDVSEKFARVTITGVDVMDILSGCEMHPTFHGDTPPDWFPISEIYFPDDQQVDDRIKQALTDIGWPTGTDWRRIFSGNVSLQEKTYARTDSPLTVIQDAADAEWPGVANVFPAKDGAIVFHGRLARFNPTNPSYNINFWKCGDKTACANPLYAPISGLALNRGNQYLYNRTLALPSGVDESDVPTSVLENTSPQSRFGVRTWSASDLLVLHGDEGPDLDAVTETGLYAQYYLDNYSEPGNRVREVTFRIKSRNHPNAAALWGLLCGIEISDVLTVYTTHKGGGGVLDDYFVEGIRMEADPMGKETAPGQFDGIPNLTATLELSPRSYYTTSPF